MTTKTETTETLDAALATEPKAKRTRKPRAAKPAVKATAKRTNAKAKVAAKAKGKRSRKADAEEEEEGPRSVVKALYKARYRERGDVRNCGDWLAAELKALVLDEDGRLDVAALERVCKANDVDPRYENRSRGWEGRMRMTLGLKLRPIVAQNGGLYVPGKGRSKQLVKAPKAFVAKHAH